MKKLYNLKKKIMLTFVLGLALTLVITPYTVKAFNSEITYMDTDFFDPDDDYSSTLSINTWTSTSLNIYSSVKAGNVLIITLPSSITFVESLNGAITIDVTYLISESLADAPIYYIASVQLFTFDLGTYNLVKTMESHIADGYDIGYTTGYSKGYENGSRVGITKGHNDLYTFGSNYYGLSEVNSFDYKKGLIGTNVKNNTLEGVYDYGISAYIDPDTGLPFVQSGSKDYIDGQASSVGNAYNDGYIAGGNESFQANIGDWIVPAIVIVLIVGGIIGMRQARRRNE